MRRQTPDPHRGFERSTLKAEKTTVETPMDRPFLPNQQEWLTMDHRGNWERMDESTGVPPLTVAEHRTVNAVNEYLTITLGPDPARSLTHDDTLDTTPPRQGQAGNLTHDPLARNAGDGAVRSGQFYEYDEENRLTTVRRGTDSDLLLDITYDALDLDQVPDLSAVLEVGVAELDQLADAVDVRPLSA